MLSQHEDALTSAESTEGQAMGRFCRGQFGVLVLLRLTIYAQATTAARVAYSAVALTIIGYPLLDKIEAIRTAPAPKPRSGGVTAELEAAAAAGAAAAAAALKGTHKNITDAYVHSPTNQKCAGCLHAEIISTSSFHLIGQTRTLKWQGPPILNAGHLRTWDIGT